VMQNFILFWKTCGKCCFGINSKNIFIWIFKGELILVKMRDLSEIAQTFNKFIFPGLKFLNNKYTR
jgi:hypothetical protein